MNEIVYQIIPVANGFMVILPIKFTTQWDGLQEVAESIKAKEAGLPIPEKDTEGKANKNTFIFYDLSEAIAFLKLKIEKEI